MIKISTVNTFNFEYIFSAISTKWYLYIALFVVLLSVLLFAILTKKTTRNNLSHTQKIAYVSIFSAISFVFNIITMYPVSFVAISFLMTIGIVAGFLLGSKCAFVVCFVGDLLGAILFPSGAYNPVIAISSGLMGFIPGIVFERTKWRNYVKVIVSAIICLIVCTFFLNTFGLWFMYSSGFWLTPSKGTKTFFAYLIIRMPWQTIVSVGNTLISLLLVQKLAKIMPKNKFNLGDNYEDRT